VVISNNLISERIVILIISSYSLFTLMNHSELFYIFTVSSILFLYLMNGLSLNNDIFKLLTPLYGFSFLCMISVVWSVVPDLTFKKSIALIIFIVLGNIVANIYVSNNKFIYHASAAISLVISAVFLYLYLNYGTVRHISRELNDITTVVSNSNAAYLALVIPILMSAILDRESKTAKVVYVVSLSLAGISIIVSQSRGAYALLVLGVGLFVLLYHSSKSGRKYTLNKILTIITISVMTIPLFMGNLLFENEITGVVIERMESSKFISSSGTTDNLRGDMIESMFDIIQENPLLGIGFEGYSLYSAGHQGTKEFSHNIFLTSVEVGVFGLLLWIYIFIKSTYNSYKTYKRSDRYRKNINLALLISLLLGLLHALVRPQLQNLIFIVIISISLLSPQTRLKLKR